MRITTYAKYVWDGKEYVLVEEVAEDYSGPVALCDSDHSSDSMSDGDGGSSGNGASGDSGYAYEQDDLDLGAAQYDSWASAVGDMRGGVGDDPQAWSESYTGMGYADVRGLPGDDPTVRGADWPGMGNQYTYPGRGWNDQPDIYENYPAGIMGSILGLLGWGALTFSGALGAIGLSIDPIEAAKRGWDLGKKIGGEYTSHAYDPDRSTIDTGAGDWSDSDSAFANDEAFSLSYGESDSSFSGWGGSTKSKQKKTKDKEETKEPEAEKTTTTEEMNAPNEMAASMQYDYTTTPEITISKTEPYVYFNFPPPESVELFEQPEASVWYV